MRTMQSRSSDLEQAESDRNQAQADLNAAEQGMKILGIKDPSQSGKCSFVCANPGTGANQRRSG